MNHETPAFRQILLAYALLGSIAAALWFAVGQPLADELSQRESRVAALVTRVDTLRGAIARDTALRPEIAAEQMERLRSFIHRAAVDADTLEVGGSLLQRRLTRLIERHGGKPGNTRVSTNPDVDSMTVSTRFEADLEALAAVLFEVAKSEQPLMIVDLLSVRRGDRYLETQPRSTEPALVVQMDVTAFWRRTDGSG